MQRPDQRHFSSRLFSRFITFAMVGLVLISAACLVQPVRAAETLSTPPNDPYWQKQWYLRKIDAPGAWEVATGTSRVVVAVIDGGVDITHPDLRDNIWTNPQEVPGDGIDNDRNGYIDDVHGWNFINGNADVRPVFKPGQEEEAWSHGTIVASLIGAKGNDHVGIAGVAWNVRIMPLVVLDGDGAGQTRSVMKAIRYAVSKGANIINLSLVGYDYDPALDELIRNAADAGVMVVAANGNDPGSKTGIDLDETPAYPVCDDRGRNAVFGVSGTNQQDQKADYANFGRSCTDISAPGQGVFAARPSYNRPGLYLANVPNYIDGITGTSLAAPLVSGVAALIKSVRPEWTVAQIQRRIMETADPIEPGFSRGEMGILGAGRLNAAKALRGLVMTVFSEPVVSIVSAPVAPLPVSAPVMILPMQEVKVTPAGVEFLYERDGRRWKKVLSGKGLTSGWIDRGAGRLPLAYTVRAAKQGYAWQSWDPESDRVQNASYAFRNKGPWTFESAVWENGSLRMIFFSKTRAERVRIDGARGTYLSTDDVTS